MSGPRACSVVAAARLPALLSMLMNNQRGMTVVRMRSPSHLHTPGLPCCAGRLGRNGGSGAVVAGGGDGGLGYLVSELCAGGVDDALRAAVAFVHGVEQQLKVGAFSG